MSSLAATSSSALLTASPTTLDTSPQPTWSHHHKTWSSGESWSSRSWDSDRTSSSDSSQVRVTARGIPVIRGDENSGAPQGEGEASEGDPYVSDDWVLIPFPQGEGEASEGDPSDLMLRNYDWDYQLLRAMPTTLTAGNLTTTVTLTAPATTIDDYIWTQEVLTTTATVGFDPKLETFVVMHVYTTTVNGMTKVHQMGVTTVKEVPHTKIFRRGVPPTSTPTPRK